MKKFKDKKIYYKKMADDEVEVDDKVEVDDEIAVVRTPIVGKYYEATFWTRRTGTYPGEKHYTKKSVQREYAGLYLRHKQQGYGDGADHWAIFLRDGVEIEIEYDYDGKRAFYEVFVF